MIDDRLYLYLIAVSHIFVPILIIAYLLSISVLLGLLRYSYGEFRLLILTSLPEIFHKFLRGRHTHGMKVLWKQVHESTRVCYQREMPAHSKGLNMSRGLLLQKGVMQEQVYDVMTPGCNGSGVDTICPPSLPQLVARSTSSLDILCYTLKTDTIPSAALNKSLLIIIIKKTCPRQLTPQVQ